MLDYGSSREPACANLSFPIVVPMFVLAYGPLQVIISSYPILSEFSELLQRFMW